MTREDFRKLLNASTRYGSAPTVCLLGEDEYLSLHESVLTCVCELVPNNATPVILTELARLNVCAFYYNGVICIKGRDQFGVHFA